MKTLGRKWRWSQATPCVVFVVVVVLISVLLCFAVFWEATEHIRIEARTGFVEIDITTEQPIAWALGEAQLLEYPQLARMASQTSKKERQERIAKEAEIEIAAIKDADGKCLHMVRAKASLDRDDFVLELEPMTMAISDIKATPPQCSNDASPVAVLDRGDGKRSGISLPAQLRLAGEKIGNGLTLEFRGNVRIGNDVSSSRQLLLTSGRFTLRQVRSSQALLQLISDAHFDIESRDLGLGDKVTIAVPSRGKVSDDLPQGFVRIINREKTTEMSVYATTVAAHVEIVRPFSTPEKPKAHWLRRLWADELLSKLAGLIVVLITLYFGFVQYFEARSRNDVPRDPRF